MRNSNMIHSYATYREKYQENANSIKYLLFVCIITEFITFHTKSVTIKQFITCSNYFKHHTKPTHNKYNASLPLIYQVYTIITHLFLPFCYFQCQDQAISKAKKATKLSLLTEKYPCNLFSLQYNSYHQLVLHRFSSSGVNITILMYVLIIPTDTSRINACHQSIL